MLQNNLKGRRQKRNFVLFATAILTKTPTTFLLLYTYVQLYFIQNFQTIYHLPQTNEDQF